MSDRNKFKGKFLFELLNRISTETEVAIKGYLIGGLAMIFHGSKMTTKDIDIVFHTRESVHVFTGALKKIGFRKMEKLTPEYDNLNTWNVFEGENGCRFDIFLNTICNCLELSQEMKNRANEVFSLGNFTLFSISPEDIFLFKSITSRADDLMDMSIIASRGIEWDIIESELRNQSNYWKWLLHYYTRLEKLEEEFKIISPTTKKLAEEAEISAGILVLLNRFEEYSLYLDDVMKILDENDRDYSVKVLDKMKELGFIREEDGLFHIVQESYPRK